MILTKEQKRFLEVCSPMFVSRVEMIERDAAFTSRFNLLEIRVEKAFKALEELNDSRTD